VAEAPAIEPYSWHDPQPPPAYTLPPALKPPWILRFKNAKNMLGFVDGHVAYTKIYWNDGIEAICYEPLAGYD
jgi:prepilin-type processing-associated H-X9-DG protein